MAKTDPNEQATRGVLDEAVEAILEGVGNMFSERDKRFDDIDKRFDAVDKRLDKVEDELRGVKIELSHVKSEINGLEAELSDTPSRREFNELKDKVEEHIHIPH